MPLVNFRWLSIQCENPASAWDLDQKGANDHILLI